MYLNNTLIFREAWAVKKEKYEDIHSKLMRKYKLVPQRLFKIMILIATIVCIINSQIYMKELEIPFLGIILATVIPATLVLPLGIIEATSGMVRPFSLFPSGNFFSI